MKKLNILLLLSAGALLASCGQRVLSSSSAPEPSTPAASSQQPQASSEASQPASTSEASEPAASSEASQPAATSEQSSEASQPSASSEASQPASSEASQPAASSEASQPAESSQILPGKVYTLSIGGNPYTLTDVSASKDPLDPDPWIAQFKATGISAEAGDAVVFTCNATPIQPGAAVGDNNVLFDEQSHGLTVITTGSDLELYLKEYEDGGYAVWLTGYKAPATSSADSSGSASSQSSASSQEAEVYALKIGQTNYAFVETQKGQGDTWEKQLKASGITAAAGDEIVITLNGSPISSGASGTSNNAVIDAETSKMTVAKAGSNLEFYLKVYTDGYDVWMTGNEAEPSTLNTVYFSNNKNWQAVYIYAFGGTGASMTWPGVAMTFSHQNPEHEDVYVFEGLAGYSTIIFSNGDGDQTIDIPLSNLGENNGVYISGEKVNNKYPVGFWKYTPQA